MSKPKSIKELAIDIATKEAEIDKNQPMRLQQEAYMSTAGYQFRYNIVRLNFQVKKDSEPWQDIEERFYTMLQRDFELDEHFGYTRGGVPSTKRLENIISTPITSTNYDPFKVFFTTNKWDGIDRITQLTKTVTPVAHKFGDFTSAWAWENLFKRWLIASVRCMLAEGANHVMLLFISTAHGLYKTTWLNHLYPTGLGSEHAGITEKIDLTGTNKDILNFLAEKAIWNIDDQMDSIFGKEYGAIKTFITKEWATLRKSFAKQDKTRPRRCNFVGSVNKRQLFTDHQNRRYLDFEIEKINIEAAKKIDINQLWLQAYELYRKGEKCYFDKADEAIINQMADEYTATSTELDWFLKCFEVVEESNPDRHYYQHTEILSVLKTASGLNVYSDKLTTALQRMDIKPVQKRILVSPGKSQPRDVFVLKERFIKETNGRIIPLGDMNYKAMDYVEPAPPPQPPTQLTIQQ